MEKINPEATIGNLRRLQSASGRQPESTTPTADKAERPPKLGSRYEQADLEGADEAVRRFVADLKGGLFITGPVGTGKTYLAAAIANQTGAMVTTVPKLLFRLRNSFRNDENEAEIINRHINANILVLDDLGAEKTTDYSLQSLYLIIDERYRNDLPTVVTSNLSLSGLAEKLDDRIASRLTEMCEIVKLDGPDRRLNKVEAAD